MLIFPTAIMMMEDEDDRAFMEKLYAKGEKLRLVHTALVNKTWTEQVPKPRIKRSAITLQTPSLTEP